MCEEQQLLTYKAESTIHTHTTTQMQLGSKHNLTNKISPISPCIRSLDKVLRNTNTTG